MRFDGNLSGARRGAARGDRLSEVVQDRPEDLGLDDAVYARPAMVGSGRSVEEDVVLEGELADDEELSKMMGTRFRML